MATRLTPLLVLAAICTQIALGGLRSSAVLCLGGDAAHDACTSDCGPCEHQECRHEPLGGEHHDEGCSCTDVELTLLETSFHRPAGDESDVPTPLIASVVPKRVEIRPHWELGARLLYDPGGGGRFAIARSTRLNL